MSSLWTLEKLWHKWGSSLCRRSTVGVQRAMNSGWSVTRGEEENEGGWCNDWKLPLTNMEQQLPCCSLKALEVCIRHTKLLSAGGQQAGQHAGAGLLSSYFKMSLHFVFIVYILVCKNKTITNFIVV